MRFLVWLIAGIAGGILGGMGMGGGTVLIPILTIFCGVPQHMAQSVNLFTFLPMSLLSLRVHAKNGLLDTKGAVWMMVPATLLSALGALFVQGLAPDALRVCFGAFLCLLSLCQFCSGLRSLRKNARQPQKKGARSA